MTLDTALQILAGLGVGLWVLLILAALGLLALGLGVWWVLSWPMMDEDERNL
jgi:hypothetical protein